ncbi:Fc.00g087570.m01.CDS01 [Cosmosporella sp. VM-42]
MKSFQILAALSLLSQYCSAATVDLWSKREAEPRDPVFKSIEPEEIIARLGTLPSEYKPDERHPGMVYFCRDENWGPPCYVYDPEQHYHCQKLNPELSNHVGSVFVEQGTICRFAKLKPNINECGSTTIFAWPETKQGWPDLFQRESPGTDPVKFLGYDSTHFMCAKCTACE